jgi:hypothetical protein
MRCFEYGRKEKESESELERTNQHSKGIGFPGRWNCQFGVSIGSNCPGVFVLRLLSSNWGEIGI